MKYDVLIVGAGPGGIFAAYELMNNDPENIISPISLVELCTSISARIQPQS